jgi:hypothetical protein
MTDHDEHDENTATIDADEQLEHVGPRALATPTTLTDLSPRDDAEAIMSRRGRLMDTARRIMIAATFPADYVANRDPDGRVTLYLQTKGAHRLVDILGIETYNIGKPERIPTSDPKIFYYIVSGSARARLTGRVIENIEGGRSSAEFVKEKSGIDLEMHTRTCARTNLEGRAARILSGLAGIPAEFVDEVWKDTPKRTDQCPRGKGFGTRDERQGGRVAPDAGIDPPVCRLCKGAMQLRHGQKGDFYSCPKWKEHGKDAYTVDAGKWIKEHPAKLTPAQAAGFTGAPTTPPQPTTTTPPTADEIFGNHEREPGEDDE